MSRLIAAWCCALAVACAMGVAGKPSVVPSGAARMTGDPKAEIDRLAGEIERERAELGLPEPAVPDGGAAVPMTTAPASTDPTCKPSATDRCTSVCTLGDSICRNAKKICDLAQELPGDAWAAQTCERGKAVCKTAHASCCDCR